MTFEYDGFDRIKKWYSDASGYIECTYGADNLRTSQCYG